METPSDNQGASAGRSARGRGSAQGQPSLAPGTVLAGRYQIARAALPSPFGTVYAAQDQQANHPVFLRHVNPQLLGGGAPQKLQAELQAARRVVHKNLVRIVDLVGTQQGAFVVTDHVQGVTLRQLLADRRAKGAAGLSLKSAVNVLAHLCNGLSAAHATMFHGALSASNVLVDMAGRVRIMDLGFARPLTQFPALLPEVDRHALAPELAAGRPADARVDVYSLGAILYELLVGRPASGLAKLTQLLPELPAELDAIIDRCMSPNAGERPGDPQRLKQVLWQLVDTRGAEASQAMSVAQIREVAAMQAHRSSAARLAAVLPRPSREQAAQKPSGKVDETEEKWLVNKGGLDFGPYSMIQLKDLIAKDDVQLGHHLIDNESGMKVHVEDHPLLHDLVMQAAQRREDAARHHIVVQEVKRGKRHGRAFFALIGVAVVGVGLGAFFIIRAVGAKGDDGTRSSELSALDQAELKNFKVGGVKRVRGGKKRAGPRTSAGPASPDSDSLAFDMEDDSVGDDRLDDSQINSVVSANGGGLAGCILAEGRRSGTRSADIEFSVAGSGKVNFVRVNGETRSELARCIYGKMSRWRFPSFNGTRTRASFAINM